MSSSLIQTLSEADVTKLKDQLSVSDRTIGRDLFGIVFISPAMLFLILLMALPVVYAVYLSLHSVNIFQTGNIQFVGLQNYSSLYNDPVFWDAMYKGVVFSLGAVGFQLVTGIGFALVLNKQFFGSSIARTLAVFPYLVPTIAVAMMWEWMLSPSYGIVNIALTNLGIINEPIGFFSTKELAMPILILASSWKFTSFAVLIFLARLQSIDEAMYEQAKIAGASVFQMFRTITLPNLKSAIMLVVLLRGIWMFQKFDIVWLLTQGGPLEATQTLPVYIYKITFFEYQLDIGSAAAINLFVILVVIAIIYFWALEPSKEIETGR